MCVSPPAPHTYCCLGLTASCIKLLPRGLPRTSSRHPWMALRVFVLEEGMEGKEMLLAPISQVLGNLLLTSLWAVSLPEPLTGITNQGWLGPVPFLVAERDGPYRWGWWENERRAAQGRGMDVEQAKSSPSHHQTQERKQDQGKGIQPVVQRLLTLFWNVKYVKERCALTCSNFKMPTTILLHFPNIIQITWM